MANLTDSTDGDTSDDTTLAERWKEAINLNTDDPSEPSGISFPDVKGSLITFATNPRRTIIGVIVSTIVGYVVWFGEVSIAGLLAAAGFKVGIPDAPETLPGLSEGPWIVPPQDYTGPVDLPRIIYDIVAGAIAPVGQAFLGVFVTINTRIASLAAGPTGLPALVAPVVVLGLWTVEFIVLIWIGRQALSLGKTLALDTLNPL